MHYEMRDPCEKLNFLIELYNKGKRPRKCGEWAISALETAESILSTIEEMQANNADAPTEDQVRALNNIYDAACRWIWPGGKPLF